jgi:iron-sulfur cluster assembly protein
VDLITVTPQAAERAKQLLAKVGKPQGAIRVKVDSGGCSGLSYKLEPADAPGPQDAIVEAHGVRVFLDKKSLLYLAGSELSYESGLMGSGFKFKNPNAVASCSCGESFTV